MTERSGGPDSLRALVRQRKEQGADVIKLFASKSIREGGAQTMTDEQLAAACGEAKAVGVKVAAIVEDRAPFQRRHDPSHPDADAEGFVAMPNVNTPEEMVDMLSAARAYQANLTAINLVRDMIARALELGR